MQSSSGGRGIFIDEFHLPTGARLFLPDAAGAAALLSCLPCPVALDAFVRVLFLLVQAPLPATDVPPASLLR